MNGLNEYEKQRQLKIEENKKVLESLGLLKQYRIYPKKPTIGIKKTKKRKRDDNENKFRSEKERVGSEIQIQDIYLFPRRSLRLKGQIAEDVYLPDSLENYENKLYRKYTPAVKRDNVFGSIEGVLVGTTWETRVECSHDGIHRPTVAGIHGSEAEGCYSLALSGGYEDDIDLGDSFTYTGEGGRDLKGTKANPKNLRTAPQSKDQTLTKGNLALVRNVENRRPVRVIRGYKLNSPFAPEQGYRYDGLYFVERYWQTTGLSGFKVFKYVLNRCPNQEQSPWMSEDL
ncbi:uncharacterized protein LOC135680918 [Rhopilema esculentum]|uniref:uncharacterized protein LOC135680918 n=1 Tax=Rhopilema esculentum TaxID=499914 RepID=UPI0031D1926D|eukprot:gene12825-3565_t